MTNVINLINLGYILDFIKNFFAIVLTSIVSIYFCYRFNNYDNVLLDVILGEWKTFLILVIMSIFCQLLLYYLLVTPR
jgi:hypothetical protein